MKEIFKTIVGSQAYGTSIPESDIDHKGVYMQSIDDLISFNYKPQIEKSKDEVHYEIRRFIELLQSANPTVLELLFSPEDCIITKSPEFDLLIQNRDKFLTKKCLMSFGGYAVAQIKKARGLDKKMNWEKDKITRKDVLDFCYVLTEKENTVDFKYWLQSINFNGRLYLVAPPPKYVQENIGLAKVNNVPDLYSMYKMDSGGGIISEDSNDVQLRSIPKYAPFIAYLRFDKMGYSQSCKDYREYTEWLDNRNTQRYVDNIGHGQQIDCYLDEETLYLTNGGWKKYDEIDNTDLLATVTKEHELKFTRILERFKHEYTGDIWSYENRYTKFSVTPNHNLFVSDVHRSLKNNFSTGYEDVNSNWHFETVENYMKGRRSWKHILVSLNNNKKNKIDLTNEELLILGAYISDGTKNGNSIVIWQCESKPLTKTIRELKDLKFTENKYYNKIRKKNYNIFRLKTSSISEKMKYYLSEIGHGTFKKRIPLDFLNLSSDQVGWFLKGLLEGDGTFNKKKGHSVYYSSSYDLISDLQLLLFNNGFNTQVYTVNTTGGFEKSKSIKYHLFISKNRKKVKSLNKQITSKLTNQGLNQKAKWCKFKVKNKNITCFTVKEGVIVTKNNDKIAIQGNSKNIMHCRRLLDVAMEIATEKTINVRRPNREYLLSIRRGEVNLDSIIEQAEIDIKKLDELYANSGLPDDCSKEFCNELLLKIRHLNNC